MSTLTELERYTARENLALDERLEHSERIDYLLDELATEIAKIRRIHDAVPDDYQAPETALALVAAVGRSNKLQGQAATIMHLIATLQDEAVFQARAHGASWAQTGQRLDEDARNIRNRYAAKTA